MKKNGFIGLLFCLSVGGLNYSYCQSGSDQTVQFTDGFETPDRFKCVKLASIAEQIINVNDKDILETGDTVFVSGKDSLFAQSFQLVKGRRQLPFIVEYDDQGKISHIGIQLFERNASFYENPVLAAVERLLFQVSLIELSGSRAADYFNAEGIKILFDDEPLGSLGFQQLDKLQPIMQHPDRFAMQWKDYTYQLRWEKEGHVARWIIPARAELITIYDKRELDQRLTEQILHITYSDVDRQRKKPVIDEKKLIHFSSNLWLERGDVFFPSVTQNRYFTKDGDNYELLFSQDYFPESIRNLLLDTSGAVYDAPLHLTIKTLKPRQLTLEYHDLIRFFSDDCNVYAGLESMGADSVQAIVVFEDRRYNQIHLCSLQIPNTFIGGRGMQELRGTLYLNIRRDNVKDIFSTENGDKKKQLFQISLN